jgi:radical SAM superfamily enzyme YgiQ (UPF0313 family)
MTTSTYAQKLARRVKAHGRPVEHVAVVYPFTYVNPYNCMPPIGPEYVQAAVIATGRTATVLDMRFERDVSEELRKADLVVMYGFFEDCSLFGKWDQHVIDEVLALVPPDVPVVAGGTGFSDGEDTLANRAAVDAVVVGMPVTPMQELLEAGTPDALKNITWRTAEGRAVRNARTTYRMPEDVFPIRRLRNPRYRYHTLGIPMDLVRAAQGCDFKCRFCYQYGKDTDGNYLRWNGRSPESQLKELQSITASIVVWVDDDMTTDMAALDRLADLLIENKVEKMLIGTGRIDHVLKSNVATLKKLERAGLLALTFGVESLKDEMLRFYRKAQKLEMVEKAVQMMNQTNIMLVCNFLLGSPGDKEADMMEFLWAGRRWKVDHLVTNRLRVPEGSELWHLIYDKETGLPKPGMERIRGRPLKRIKNRIKFGQGTPFHLARTVAKLHRHKGLALDPLYLASAAAESLGRGTWLDRTKILPALCWLPKTLGRWRPFRGFTRMVATALYPLLDAFTVVFEGIDRRMALSTRAMPALAEIFDKKVVEKQKAQAQVDARATAPAAPAAPAPLPQRELQPVA